MANVKRGRPVKPAHLKRSEIIPGFKVTKAEKKRYKKAAKAAKMSLSAWLRSLADTASNPD